MGEAQQKRSSAIVEGNSAGPTSYPIAGVHAGQAEIIAAACKLFIDRGWSELAWGNSNFTVEKEGKVFSCFLYPTDRVVAFRAGSQRLNEVIKEPTCLVLSLEENHHTSAPMYVGIPSAADVQLALGNSLKLLG